MPISLDDLSIPTSGQFFKLAAALTDQQVEEIFDQAAEGATGAEEPRQIREAQAVGQMHCFASLACFPIEGPPAFAPNSNRREKRYGFLLLLELEHSGTWFLGIFKSGPTTSDVLEELCLPISRRALVRAFGQAAVYEKLSLRRMTVSQNELRASSYEAANLVFTLPVLAVTRSIPRHLRLLDRQNDVVSITVSTSRIHKSGARANVAELAQFVRAVARETVKNQRNSFLDPFPVPVDLKDKPQKVVPTGILFDWPKLFNQSRFQPKWETDNGELKVVEPKLLLRLLGGVLLTSKDGTGWTLTRPQGVTLGVLRLNKNKYSVTELLSQKLRFVDSENPQAVKPLTTWLRRENAFQIAFSSPEFFYSDGQLYKRPEFDKDISLVEAVMQVGADLATVDSEKGKPEPSTAAETQFPQNSIFRFVEHSAFAASDFLWCDDNGDEWADYIALKGDRISFLHCKHGKHTSGAGGYQIVVAQALKNLSRIHVTPSEFESKINTAQATPMWKNVTGITELRKGNSLAAFQAAVLTKIANPEIAREVWLVISMLSLTRWNHDKAAQKKDAYFVQLVWLLASFVNSAREHGGIPRIICAP